MRTLYLIRHAKSSWENVLQTDFDRPLNTRGLRDAPAMGRFFYARGEPVDLFVSSPAVRAHTTALCVAEAFSVRAEDVVQEPRLYLANAAAWLEVVHDLPNEAKSVALFAHNPGISEFCERLTQGGLGELSTCAIVRIDAPVTQWAKVSKGECTLVWNDRPKLHAGLQ
jgi:phosphohistidine phosphatase